MLTSWSAEQIGTARIICDTCRAEGVGPDGQVIALMTAIQEASLRNLDYGDSPNGVMTSSRGAFQQQSPWGSLADRMNVAKATLLFLHGGPGGVAAGLGGLLDVPGWFDMYPGVACQTVQKSDYPDAYQAHYADAVALVAAYGGPANTQGGTMTSQNGWPSYTDYGDSALLSNSQSTVPGTSVEIQGGIRSGTAATILLEVARRFNASVETLQQSLGCWGFEPRTIRGSTTVSNHASGTAIDLNSFRHALSDDPANSFSSDQISAIHNIIGAMNGVVRWGGDYSGRKDGMHFEINTSPDEPRVAALAAQIRGGSSGGHPTSATPPAKSTSSGSQVGGTVTPFPLAAGQWYGPGGTVTGTGPSSGVNRIQQRLSDRGYAVGRVDGDYGAKTVTAVKLCQSRAHLKDDGRVGPTTWKWIKP